MIDNNSHILVIDDDSRLRDLLRRYLTKCGFRVSTAADAADARARMTGLSFDLLVIDVMMPGESGLDLARRLRATDDVPILLLTAMSEAADRIAGLETGVDDYLAKPFEPRELVLRIEAILRRGRDRRETPAKIKLGDCDFDVERGELLHKDKMVRLTSSEAALLRTFARNPGNTISRGELMTQSGDATSRAVDVQITRLRRKIEPDPKAPRYLQTVWGQGYVLWPD